MDEIKTYTCYLLINEETFKKVIIWSEFEIQEAISFFKSEKIDEVEIKINHQDIEEIREGRKTDAWMNSEAGLNVMLDKPPISQEIKQDLVYFSIVCKASQRIHPGRTTDFVTADNELVDSLQKFSHKLKENVQLLRNDPEEDSLFDSKLSHDMDQPMSHYFIASSHNTYLTGHQMTSKSSYEIYRNILLDGCRCIEIDIWEGKSTSFEPVVTHKFTSNLKLTFTSEILLKKVLEIIKEFAFVTSQYPLILSIENHLEVQSQKRLAEMLNETFGEMLYIGDIGNKTQYPRLCDMQNKIFIKDYKKLRIEPKLNQTKTKGTTDQSVKIDDSQYVDSVGDSTVACSDLDHGDSDFNYDDFDYDQWDSDEEDVPDDENPDQRHLDEALRPHQDGSFFSKSADARESLECNYMGATYPQMINYFEANKFINIDRIKEFKFNQMFSLSETKSLDILEKCILDGHNKYRQFTRRSMVRVYPGALRQDSSNYNPVCHWYAGAQMVALNYQTASVEMLINWAQFALNGGCGYVLKPEYLRTQTKRHAGIDLKIEIVKVKFVDLFSGDNKTEWKVTTCVYCPDTGKHLQTNELKRDQYSKVPMETKIIAGNAINPVQNDSMTYRLSNPELSFVLFSLMNERGRTVGQYMIAVQAMKTEGWIDLYDDKMNRIPSAKIYVKVTKTTE